MTNETCERCNDNLADIEDVEFHDACHDYMEANNENEA